MTSYRRSPEELDALLSSIDLAGFGFLLEGEEGLAASSEFDEPHAVRGPGEDNAGAEMIGASLTSMRESSALDESILNEFNDFIGQFGGLAHATQSFSITDEQAGLFLLDDLGVSPRWANKFSDAGIETVADVAGMTVEDLLRIDGIGRKAIDELQEGLRLYQLPPLSENGFLGVCVEDEHSDCSLPQEVLQCEFLGARYVVDTPSMADLVVNQSNPLGRALDALCFQETICDFLLLSDDEKDAIAAFAEKSHISWFAELRAIGFDSDNMMFGPDDTVDLFFMSTIDFLVSCLGVEKFESLLSALSSLIDRKLGISLSLEYARERARKEGGSELGLLDTKQIFRCFGVEEIASSDSIDEIIFSEEALFLELYYAIKAVKLFEKEQVLLAQADNIEMLFAQAMADDMLSSSMKFDSRKLDIVISRYGLLCEGNAPTLEMVGQRLGITRERVRQIEAKSEKWFNPTKSKRLLPVRRALRNAIISLGGACTSEELSEAISGSMHLFDRCNFSNLAKALPDIASVTKDGLIVLTEYACHQCDRAKAICDTLLSSRDCITFDEFFEFAGCLSCDVSFRPDLRPLLELGDISGIGISHGYIGAKGNAKLRAASRPQSVRACIISVLNESVRAYTIQEMVDEVEKRIGKKVSKAQVGSHLTNISEIALWDRGAYIHKRNVPMPTALLARIVDFCCERFRLVKTPLLGVSNLYEEFEDELSRSGIPCGQALYSALRMYDSSRLDLSEYPWVCDSARIGDRTTFAKYFYSVVEANNGFLTDAHAESVAKRAMAQDWALSGLAIYSKLLIHANGGWYNVETAGFDLDGVERLAIEVAEKMGDNDIVSCKKVFSDNKERCFSYGVKSYDILYRLIDLMEDDLPLTASRIPHLVKSDKPTLGVKDAVRLYIRNSPRPVSHSEILEEFGAKRGINTNGLCQAIIVGDDIVEVGFGEYWSMGNLHMDDEFVSRFDRAIAASLSTTRQEAGLYYRASQLTSKLSGVSLPRGVRWTEALLAAAFKKSERFKAFGEKGGCVVDRREHPEIVLVEDFYHALLENKFHGWTTFEKFAQYCETFGIRQEIEPEFFDAFESIEATEMSIEAL